VTAAEQPLKSPHRQSLATLQRQLYDADQNITINILIVIDILKNGTPFALVIAT